MGYPFIWEIKKYVILRGGREVTLKEMGKIER